MYFWRCFPRGSVNREINIKQSIIELLQQTARQAQESGKLPSVNLPEITIEHPQNPDHGDYATSLPLKLARVARMSPIQIAQVIADRIALTEVIAAVAVIAADGSSLRTR